MLRRDEPPPVLRDSHRLCEGYSNTYSSGSPVIKTVTYLTQQLCSLRRLKGVDHGEIELECQWFKVLDLQPRN